MNIDHTAPVDKRTPEREPELHIQECQCGTPTCDRIIVAMVRPVIKPLAPEDGGELASLVYLPMAAVQGMVDHIRKLCRDKGVRIR